MPDAATLTRMYGLDYAQSAEALIEDPKDPTPVVASLQKRSPGVFADFGCGSGALLARVAALGWTPVGIEYDARVAAETSRRTGCRIFVGASELKECGLRVDVIHLGDVIEHLPAPFDVVGDLVGILRPGGWLIAQGPLEAGPCLFSAAVRAAARLRPRETLMPPYHVIQATVRGQREFFGRLGLRELTYTVSEVAWPAPARLSMATSIQPRKAGLFFLRRVSQVASALNASNWGNRYFYVGYDVGGPH
jgi:SAM-dependent methyltransferase